ncbi:S66 peptidase family protein [Fulvivirga sedimenti]|uniref:LD-carboxypeptidase n=1 Tax=Fulvivirga sedimenti TaxID=2879465 RepID=A0A9X1KV78_9BACT|nr:LD-carboxypeptidase [Fulvivirga sedimenti]MCA6074418.1 LD-carboxypeptidase [Fulvivirga sedimenti]
MTLYPPLLKEGDEIMVISPSRKIFSEQMEASWEIFRSWGLDAREGISLWAEDGYFAGTDEQRLEEWRQALADPAVKAIFCARGGYGLTRIIDQVELDILHKHPKWIIGFSDITAVHLALDHANVASIHGLMPAQYGYDNVGESLRSLHQFLFSGKLHYKIPSVPGNRPGRVTATVIGGNLSLLAESLGTKSEIHTDGRILFIEEIDEYLYKIDRMMNQLRRAGKFDRLKGVIVGQFSDMKDTQIPFGKSVEDILMSYFHGDFPVALNFPIGHENLNLALPFGLPLTLDITDQMSVLTLDNQSHLHQG